MTRLARAESRPERRPRATPASSRDTILLTALLLSAAALAPPGCSQPQPLAPSLQSEVEFANGVVTWTTSEPTLGAVRFGERPGVYQGVAYPDAAGRGDKAFAREHRVRLLSAAPGETLYVQALDESSAGALTAGVERMCVMDRQPPDALFTWTMIDVGFGDSHLLVMPTTGRAVLVDAGERRDWPNVDLALRDAGVTRLDAVVATHIHEDHIGGLVGSRDAPGDGVLGAWPVDRFLEGGNHSGNRSAQEELLGILEARGIPRATLSPGDTDDSRPELAWDPAVRVTVLNAGGGHAIGGEDEGDWINNDSVVLRISCGDVDLVLGGDAESPVQTRLLQLGVPLESEALKVHHHGLDDSSDPVYLSTVDPRVGFIPITTYESYFGTLPSGSVLGRLRERHVDVYASDRALPLGIQLGGDAGIHVRLITDGASYEVRVTPSASRHYPGSAPDLAASRPTKGASP